MILWLDQYTVPAPRNHVTNRWRKAKNALINFACALAIPLVLILGVAFWLAVGVAINHGTGVVK